MDRRNLSIPEPCAASWDAMTGDDARRFCDQCNKHVHDLSAMTETQAVALVRTEAASLCVRYTADPDGNVLHRTRRPLPARLLLGAAALLGAMPAMASPAPAEGEPTLVDWIKEKIEVWTAETVVSQGEVEVRMGDIAESSPPPPPPPPKHITVAGRLAVPHVVVDPIPAPVQEIRLPEPPRGQTVIPEVAEALEAQRR